MQPVQAIAAPSIQLPGGVWLTFLSPDIILASFNLYDTQVCRSFFPTGVVAWYIRRSSTRVFLCPSIMFSADLSWTEPDTEKVGERRERIAKQRSTPSATPSIRSSKSSRSSIPDDRELWWTSSLRKAKSIKPSRKARPDTSRSGHSKKTSSSLPQIPQKLEIEPPHDLKDPIHQPAWTYSTSLSPTLPSGAALDPPEYEVPELEGDLSSRGTNSSGSRSSRKCRECSDEH